MKDGESCLRCGGKMDFMGREQLQLGQYGLLTGAWGQLLSGALEVDIYECRACGKLEFFSADPPEPAGGIGQSVCPECGGVHDCDDARCPHCGKRLF